VTNLRQFQVNGSCEKEVQVFLDTVKAIQPTVEWGWNTLEPGCENNPQEVQGFGYTNLPLKHLNRLADFLELQLVYVSENLQPETVRALQLIERK